MVNLFICHKLNLWKNDAPRFALTYVSVYRVIDHSLGLLVTIKTSIGFIRFIFAQPPFDDASCFVDHEARIKLHWDGLFLPVRQVLFLSVDFVWPNDSEMISLLVRRHFKLSLTYMGLID